MEETDSITENDGAITENDGPTLENTGEGVFVKFVPICADA